MLIRNAEIWSGTDGRTSDTTDVRLSQGHIAEIGRLVREPEEFSIDARGGALLPGLHDHHIHLFALAAALESIACGPPAVANAAALAEMLEQCNRQGSGWLRGIGYHEEVAGDIDRIWLDAHIPDRPARIQHRGGRLWILNSAALNELLAGEGAPPPAGLEIRNGWPTGRLYDADDWVRVRLSGTWPGLAQTSALLASYGVTGVTEMTPANNNAAVSHLAAEQAAGALLQQVWVAGEPALSDAMAPDIVPLATKIHLHETWLPPFADLCARIAASHGRGRPVAVHCVTRTELVFTLAAIAETGSLKGDRIEHASIADDELVGQIRALGLHVVTQPNFIYERGDSYLRDVATDDVPALYRCRIFRSSGIPLAGGTDAPFGRPDPWIAIRAAVDRRTSGGALIGPDEALSPEDALSLFLARGDDLSQRKHIAVGAPADLCLLGSPWREARSVLDSSLVRATFRAGRLIFDGVD